MGLRKCRLSDVMIHLGDNMLGFLYERRYIKNNSSIFKIWCWLAKQKFYQILIIPSHFVKGFYYGYNFKQIVYFCLGILRDKIYREQYKDEEYYES